MHIIPDNQSVFLLLRPEFNIITPLSRDNVLGWSDMSKY